MCHGIQFIGTVHDEFSVSTIRNVYIVSESIVVGHTTTARIANELIDSFRTSRP